MPRSSLTLTRRSSLRPYIAVLQTKSHRRRLFLFIVIFVLGYYLREWAFHSLLNRTSASRPVSRPDKPREPQTQIVPPRCNESIGRDNNQEPISANHRYTPDGLLHVNPDGIHPILELIKKAEETWQKKRERASRTLGEAVIEYKRRYKRPPPLGFDDWWDFAQEMEVQLPDEYDTIWRQLEPFWGINPKDLSKIQAIQETKPDSFTLAKNETFDTNLVRTAFSNPETWEQRALLRGLNEILELLEPVEPALHPFRAIFSPHDNPNLLSDYHIKKAALDAATAGKFVDLSRLPKPKHLGFASACAPGSPGRPAETPINQFDRPPPRTEKTFIHDHRLSMDPCLHPSIFYNHAQYVVHDVGPAPQPTLAAQFAYCSTPLFHDIQPPSFLAWTRDTEPHAHGPPWEGRTDERLLWRGSNAGMRHGDDTRWRYAQRARLVAWADTQNGTANILIPGAVEDEGWERIGHGTEVRKTLVNPAVLNIAFAGTPLGCDVQYCRYLETQFEWREAEADGGEAGRYKYVVDVDGNRWSNRFRRLLASNSLVFKATAYPEWWLDRSQPWVHYVPVQVDYSDLYDAYIFFRGGLYGEGNHDHLAKKIASAGREWSQTFWREEDMTVYFFRLLLEYARVMSPDREAMTYKG